MKASGFIAIFCSIGGPEPWTGGLPGGLIINIVWCKVLGWLGWRTFHYSGSRNEDDKLPAKFQDGAAAICAVW